MQPSRSQLRRSAGIRVSVAVLLAAGVTALTILASWGPLDASSDVVGYPTFKNFNIENYFNAYRLTIGLFPLLALGLFLGLTKLAPRIGLAVPRRRGDLRSGRSLSEPRAASTASSAEATSVQAGLVCAARTGLVGAVLGLEAGIAVDSIYPALPLGAAVYAVLALLAARLLGGRVDWALPARLAAVNSLGAVLCFAGLIAVSLSTEVQVLDDGSVKHYPWLPLWLAVPAIAILGAVVARGLRATWSAAATLRIERRMLLLVAAPVGFLLLHQGLPGDLGPLEGFHFGEQLGGARLVGEGWLPWRDVVLTHGVLQDVLYTAGRGVFGNSVWGFLAGVSMIMAPLYLISVYFLFTYLVGRNWPLLVLGVFLLIDPMVVPEHFRLILWAPLLLLLASDLDRPTAPKSVGLAVLGVVQTILAPEAVPALLGVGVVLVAYEWYWHEPGAGFVPSFRRSIWFIAATLACASLFAGFLAAQGALDDFVYVSVNLVHGFTLAAGVPPGPAPGTISDPLFIFLALAPPAAILISLAYAFTRLRLRQRIYTADWVMGSVAIFLIFYYPKFLSRMDTGHVYQQFVAAIPLILYIAFRAVAGLDRMLYERRPGALALRVTRHPASLALLVGCALLVGGTVRERVDNAAASYRPLVTARPTIERIGYTQAVDQAAYRDVSRVVDAYLDPGDRIFDFSNTPLLFHYLLGRDPSTRYFHIAVAYSAELQDDLTRRLDRARPKLIAFDNDGAIFTGLSNWDGVPNMVRIYDVGQWILDNYRPLLWTHGFTFYARRDIAAAPAPPLPLSESPTTRGVPFTVQPCTWGYAPNFLSGFPHSRSAGTAAQSRPVTIAGRRGLEILRPPGSRWSDYRSLSLIAGPSGFASRTFTLFDRKSRPSEEREISFQTKQSSTRIYTVPVGSCSQWHGYHGRRLFLTDDKRQKISAVRLIR